jgi:hypothetical protein
MPIKRRTPKHKVVAIIKQCEADINVTECAYKKDLNYWAEQFVSVNKRLDAMQFIKLNGDEVVTDFSQIIKEIYHATMSQRETAKTLKQIERWKETTKFGRFLKGWAGRILIFLTLLWIGYSSLHAFGVIDTTPREWFDWIISLLSKKIPP